MGRTESDTTKVTVTAAAAAPTTGPEISTVLEGIQRR